MGCSSNEDPARVGGDRCKGAFRKPEQEVEFAVEDERSPGIAGEARSELLADDRSNSLRAWASSLATPDPVAK